MTASAAVRTNARRRPLSNTQQFFLGMDGGEHAGAFGDRHLAVTAWRLAGRVDQAALQWSLDRLVDRHEVLRTIVHRDPDDPHQLVHPSCGPTPLTVVDHQVAPQDRDIHVDKLISAAESARQSAQQLPLLRAELHRFDEMDSLLILSAHHSATDGWSMQLLHDDLAAYYAARLAGRDPGLAPATGYSELARWESSPAYAQRAAARRGYWGAQLDGARILALRTDHPVLTENSRPYAAVHFELDVDRVRTLSALARAHRCSLFMVLLAGFCRAMARRDGGDELTVATISAARVDQGYESVVGPLLNFVPLRVRLAGCPDTAGLLHHVRDVCLSALDNDVPFTQLLAECPDTFEASGDPSSCPIAFEMVQPVVSGDGPQLAGGSALVSRRLDHETSTSDLPNGVLWNMEWLADGAVVGAVAFNPGHLERATLFRLVTEFCDELDTLGGVC